VHFKLNKKFIVVKRTHPSAIFPATSLIV